jgi:hypothetical protein
VTDAPRSAPHVSIPLVSLRNALAKPGAPAGLRPLAEMEAYDIFSVKPADTRAIQLKLYEFLRLGQEAGGEIQRAVLSYVESLAGDLEFLFPHLRRMRGLSESKQRARCRQILWRARAKSPRTNQGAIPVSWRLVDADGEDDTSGISEHPFDRKVDQHSHFLRGSFSVPEPSVFPVALHARCSVCAGWGAAPGCDPRCPLPRNECEPLWFGVALHDPFGLYGRITGARGGKHGRDARHPKRMDPAQELARLGGKLGRDPTRQEVRQYTSLRGAEIAKARQELAKLRREGGSK